MKPFDFKQFEKDLTEAAQQVVQGLAKRKDAQTICSFALCTDESGSSISATANTTSYLAKMQKEASDDPLHYKWSLAEWKHDSLVNKRLDQLSDKLSTYSMELEGQVFERYLSDLFASCLTVLKALKVSDSFAAFDKKCIVLFDVSDYEDAENQTAWVNELNEKQETAEFETWLKSQAG